MCSFPKGPRWFPMARREVSGTSGAINRFVPVMNPVPYFSNSFIIHAPACITRPATKPKLSSFLTADSVLEILC